MIKAVVFDLSGVIWKRRPFNKDFFLLLSKTVSMHPKTVKAKYRLVVSQLQIGKLTLNQWLRSTFSLSRSDIATFNQNIETLFISHYEKNFYPKSIHLLRLLRANHITVGCLTNTEDFLAKLLIKAGFFCNFDFKIVSSKVGYRKPNQKIYKKIFNIGNWKPDQVVYIDDHKANIESARKLGIHGIKFKSYKKLTSHLDILNILIPLLIFLFLPTPLYAQCPICIVTVGGGMILAQKLGVDDLLASIWVAGLNTAIAFYLATKIKKPKINPYILAAITNSFTIIYFFATNQIVPGVNQIIGIDKILLGQFLGFFVVSFSYFTDRFIRSKNEGKVLFYYQRVILPVSYLLFTSLLLNLFLI